MARKKKSEEPVIKPVGTKIEVEADIHGYVTRHGDREDRWDRDDTAQDVSITGIKIVDEKGYGDLEVNYVVDPNKEYYLVLVNYDTGDSFGRDEGQVCYVDLFESKEKAQALVDAIYNDKMGYPKYFDHEMALEAQKKQDKKDGKKVEKSKPKYEVVNQVKYLLDDGTEATCYTGTWKGYFEHFNYVEAIPVSVSGGRYRRSY